MSEATVDPPRDSTASLDEIGLFVGLGAAYLFLLLVAFDFSSSARLFPLVTISALLVLIGIRVQQLIRGTAVDEPSLFTQMELDDVLSGDDEAESFERVVRACVWPLALVSVMYVFGLYAAIPVLLFAFMYVESEFSLLKITAITVVVFVLIVLLFDVILNMRSYDGIFFE